MDRLAGRHSAFYGIEKADEFGVAMALHATADDAAVEHAEGGEQGGGAVPLIIVGHGLAAAWLQGQPGLGTVEGLDLVY
jgi:hypothetical protein